MEHTFYLLKGKVKTGPYTNKDLKNLTITDKDMIWYDGLKEWVIVTEIPELSEHLTITPTPVLTPPTPMELLGKQRAKAEKQAWKQTLLLFLIIGLGVFVIMGGLSSDEQLKVSFPERGDNPIYADAMELRLLILPCISFLFIALPVSILIFLIKYLNIHRRNPKIAKP